MKKFHFNITIDEILQNAGTKANRDCKTILLDKGFIDLEVGFKKSILLFPYNLTKLIIKLIYYYFAIARGSLIITQYPLLGINKYFISYAALLRKKKCTVCCIIHDIEAIRKKVNISTHAEIKYLSAYDVVISHNNQMSYWLKSRGYEGEMVELTLFDYLAGGGNDKKQNQSGDQSEIIFAGNLAKCEFINNIHKIPAVDFNLYGPGYSVDSNQKYNNVNWLGSFPVNEIIHKINGKFGLIWDGDSIYECKGLNGIYLQYNTPHKLSLYLAAGLPVIYPKAGALSQFIEENKIGFTVISLIELEEKTKSLSEHDYTIMRENALQIGEMLKKGAYLSDALLKVEDMMTKNEKVN